MRSLILFLLFLTISVFVLNYIQPGFLYNLSQEPLVKKILKQTPCDQPIHYKIESVDPRFGISESTFQNDVNEATDVWAETDGGKQMFIYDPESTLTISMIYDERQSLDNQISSLENSLDNNKTSIDQQINDYESLAVDFKSKLSDFNSQVAYWNSRGGAPPDVYAKLSEQQRSLQDEANRLDDLAKKLNRQTANYNSQVNSLNQTVNQFNSALAQRPEEGIYNPKRNAIDIYFGNNHDELVHTIAHELGHTMGLDHNSNPDSIMYPYTTKTLTPTTDDANEVKNICQL